MRVVAPILLALALAAPALGVPVDVYCDFATRRVLGVVARAGERPPLVDALSSVAHRDTADLDLKALSDAGVPIELWRCSPDLSTVVRMTSEEAELLPAPGAEARAAARAEIERSLVVDALLTVVVDEVARLIQPAPLPARTVAELRAAAVAAVAAKPPAGLPTATPQATPTATSPAVPTPPVATPPGTPTPRPMPQGGAP